MGFTSGVCSIRAVLQTTQASAIPLSYLEGDTLYEQASLFLFTSGETIIFFFSPPPFLKDTFTFSSSQPPFISILTYLPNLNRSLRTVKTLGKRELCRIVHFKIYCKGS